MSHRRLLSLASHSIRLSPPSPSSPAPPPLTSQAPTPTASSTPSPQYRGKYVVLEWANKGCPYDQKHYLSGSMETHQREWTAKGVIWLSVISSAPGAQGYVTPSEENSYIKSMHVASTAVLLDPTSTIARLYEAKTTPHMFVIDPTGKLIYQGAIDDKPTTDQEDLKGAATISTKP